MSPPEATTLLTLVRIVQSITTILAGLAVGYAYAWKLALVGMGGSCFPISCFPLILLSLLSVYPCPGVYWLYTFGT